MSEEQTIVIDNGSGMVKAGIAGEECPRSVFPAIVGYPKHDSAMTGVNQSSFYLGEEAMAKKGVLNIKYPIEHGIVKDWDDMQRVWEYTFTNMLRVKPEEATGVMLTEAPQNPAENRETMCQIMFEYFRVKNIHIAIQAVMSLYAAGRTTGLVVDSGDGVSHTIPVYEGYMIKHAVNKMSIAGRQLTEFMQKLMIEQGEEMTSASEFQIVRDIKEEHCYVALDYEAEMEQAQKSSENDATYVMPDKRVLKIPGTVRMKCPELLFNPDLQGLTCNSIQKLTYTSIDSSDVDIRSDISKNIILSGGSTLYKGLADRLHKELVSMCPTGAQIKIIASADRKYAVWRGASTLASLSTFSEMWLSAYDYAESGPDLIAKRFN